MLGCEAHALHQSAVAGTGSAQLDRERVFRAGEARNQDVDNLRAKPDAERETIAT